MKDLKGQRFGRLAVIEKTSERVCRRVVWKCVCDCGKECFVQSGSLLSGKTKSCGCYLNEIRGVSRTSHHRSSEKVYGAWIAMKKRCFNENDKSYKFYGGRGIRVCDEWKDDFQSYYDYVSQLPHFGEEGYTLDRINNDGNYEPGNVRWATKKEQALNRRSNRNRREVVAE